MVLLTTPESISEVRNFTRTLASLRSHGRMDAAFGGRVHSGAKTLEITHFCGTRTRSLANLVVQNGAGIGGKALVLGRPVSVPSYLQAKGITHAYDHAVRPEALETVAVLPIVVNRIPRLVVYLAARTQVGLGDRWFESFRPLVQRVGREIAVDDEVRRRLSLIQAAGSSDSVQSQLSSLDLRDISEELMDLADRIEDETISARLHEVVARFTAASDIVSPRGTVVLTPRELSVLKEVGLGLTNRQVAEALGLLPNTVKSYLRTAMRKLHAGNRVQAILAAREAGLIH